MKTSILFILLLSVLSCGRQANSLNLGDDKLLKENTALSKQIDSLNEELKKVKLESNYWFDINNEGVEIVKKGIKDPEKFIENSLRENKEIIPLKPTLGGKMQFENIQVLADKWLIADYSDGHVSGRTIYSYKLNENNKLEFKALNSIEP